MERVSSNTPQAAVLALEICVDSVASAIAAEQGGAQRVELCDYLAGGGTTPSAGMIKVVREKIAIGLHVLIRPRRGDFLYSGQEFEIMKRDIEVCKKLGADGVVIGILNKNGTIDKTRMQELIKLARPLSITFHRAFDLTPDPFEALDDLMQLGIDRLLTSGQQGTAQQGISLIKELHTRAVGKLIIMPGSGINPGNVREIITETGVSEIHASVRKKEESDMVYRATYPPMSASSALSEYENLVADAEQVKAMLVNSSQPGR